MPLIINDRVKETTATAGTGTITLGGATAGFQTFSNGIGTGNTTFYTIVDSNNPPTFWEVGLGTYSNISNTLTRDTVYSSSAGGAKVSLSGVSFVFSDYPATQAVYESKLAAGANITINKDVANNQLIIASTASGGSVSVNGSAVSSPNFQNNSAALGTNLTVSGSNITAAVRNADVAAVADAEILNKWGGLDSIIRDPDQIVPIIAQVNPSSIIFDDRASAILVGNYIWINSTAQNTGGTLVFAQSGQNHAAFQYQINTVGNPITAGFTNTIAAVYYSKSSTPANNFIISPTGATQAQWGTVGAPLALSAANSLTSPTDFGPGTSGQVLTSAGPGRSPSWQNASTPVTLASSIDLGSSYVGDNIGSLVRVVTTAPTYSNIAGSIASVNDFGSVNITSTWPPTIPAGFNTYFVVIEASDFSWSGVGTIQTTPSNAIVQIAWIRRPTVAVGTNFTNARLWITTNSTAAQWVTTSTANIANVNPTTALILPDLTSGSITTASDGYGANASLVQVVPTINNQIALNIGSAGSSTSGYVAGNVSSVTTGFGNTGTTWTAQIANYAAAVTFMQAQGATPPAGGAAGNWTLPTWSLFISNLASPTATQFGTISTISSNPTNSLLVITFTGNQAYFANVGPGGQPLFIANNKFTFVPAPQNEVIRLAQANDVSSLQGLRQDVALTSTDNSVAITTSGQNINLRSAGSGGGGGLTVPPFIQEVYGNFEGTASVVRIFNNNAYVFCPLASDASGGVLTINGVPVAYMFTDQTQDVLGYSFHMPNSFGTKTSPTQVALTALTVAGGTATFTLAANTVQFAIGAIVTVANCTPNSLNGNYRITARASATSLTGVPVGGQTGTRTAGGTLQIAVTPYTGCTFRTRGNTLRNMTFTVNDANIFLNFGFTRTPYIVSEAAITDNADPTLGPYQHPLLRLPTPGQGSLLAEGLIQPATYQGLANTSATQVTLATYFGNTAFYSATNTLYDAEVFGNTRWYLMYEIACGALTGQISALTLGQDPLNDGSIEIDLSLGSGNIGQAATQSLAQTLAVGNTTGAQVAIAYQDSGSNTVSLSAPATVTTSYALTLPAVQGAANTTLLNNGSGVLSWGTAASNLTQVLTNGNSAANLNLILTGTGTLQSTAGLQLNGSTSGNLTLRAAAATTSYTLTLPQAQGAANTFLLNNGSGILSWDTPPVPNLGQVLNSGNSASNTNLILTGTGTLQTSAGLQLNGTTSGNTTLRAAASTTSYAITLPPAQGAAGQTMVNDGSGNLTWQAGGSGGSISWQQGGSAQTGAVTTLNLNTNLTGSFNSGVLTINSGGSSGVNLPWLTFTATAGQTAFTNATISNYTTTTALVIYNSSVLIPTVDYSISGQTLTLVTATIAGDVVAIGPTNAAGPGGGNILSWADYSAASRYNSSVNPVPNITATFPVGGNQVGTVHNYVRYSSTGASSPLYRFVPNTDGALTQPSYDSFWNSFSANTLSGLLVQRGTLQ